MIGQFSRFLFGDVPVQLPSAFPLQESVERLKSARKHGWFSYLFRDGVVGSVTSTKVQLQRLTPFLGNSFKPIFVGKFFEIEGQTVLKGRFTMFAFSKIFMSIWLGFALFWTCLATLGVGLSFVGIAEITPETWFAYLFPFIGAGFFGFGVLFLRLCWWLSRNDMVYLMNCMTGALQSDGANDPSGGKYHLV